MIIEMIIQHIQTKQSIMNLHLILFTLLFAFLANSQNDILKTTEKKQPCYERQNQANNNRIDVWACGKIAGVIDCDEELEVDDRTGLVIRKIKDRSNYAGVGKPYSGKCESCYQNGLINRRLTFVDGKEDGIDTSYYESGCVQAIRSQIKGVESGTWYYYFDSTQQVAWEMNFYAGEKNGRHIYMKANGDTTKEETYKNGLLHGVKKSFYKDSKIFKEVMYANGLMDGAFKTFNPEGVLTEESLYKEGKRNDVTKYFYDDGVLLKTENWKMGKKNGEFKMFYYQGNVQTLENFKDGIKEGKFQEYYPDQSPKRLAVYVKNELTEEHLFDEQGNETYTFGAALGSGDEDDKMDRGGKKERK